jgi:hypothetical protein
MPTPEEIKERSRLNNAFLAGEKILGIKFRHNSQVAFVGEDDIRSEGWIVAVGPIEPEPVYTVECCDGSGDEEVLESKLELILDPHENPTA